MNKHFDDSLYYLKRAGETARAGIAEELQPLERRLRELGGGDGDPEPSRVEKLQADLEVIQERAEGEAREAIGKARERIDRGRDAEQSA